MAKRVHINQRYIHMHPHIVSLNNLEEMNRQYQKDGWELVTVIERKPYPMVVYKRPVTDSDISGIIDSLDPKYWSDRCRLLERINEKSPCDPDITKDQIEAWKRYHHFIKSQGDRDYL